MPVWWADDRLIDTTQTACEGSEIFIRNQEVHDPLPQATREQLLQLWQASLTLVQGASHPPPRPPAEPVSETAEPYATTPYY